LNEEEYCTQADSIEMEVSRLNQECKQKIHTGAKNLANGTPLLRANAQSCREAAARQAMPAIASQNIRIVDKAAEAERLCVVL
jgi:hypothetical protein